MNYALILAAALLAQTEPGNNDLSGIVTNAENQPIARATIFIYTAKPRVGASVLCPSCYVDCRKTAVTDASGKFTVAALDQQLLFRVLVVAEGCRPTFAAEVDPQKKPLEVKLEKIPENLAGRAVMRGKIVDPQGKPVVGAVVSPSGCKRIDRRWWGSMPGVDAASVTNEHGEFFLTGNEGDLGYDLDVECRGFTKKRVELLPTGEKVHEIALTEGATVTGRILLDGKPAASVAVGLCQCDRGSQTFVGGYTIATDVDGRFTFSNVHPNDQFYLYTHMSGTANRGGIPIAVVEVGGDGTVKEVPAQTLKPGYRIAGKVMLTDEKPVPASTRILLDREEAWDSQTATLAADGGFRFEGVPEEAINLCLRVPGYRVANKRNRLQQIRTGTVAVFVDEDKPELKIYFEPEKN